VAGETHADLVRRLIVPELSPFDSGDPYTLICIRKSPNQADTYPVVCVKRATLLSDMNGTSQKATMQA